MSLTTSFLRASRAVAAPQVLAAALVSASSRAVSFALKTLSGGFGLGKLGLFAMASWTALPTVRRSLADLGRERTAMGPLIAVLDFIMPPIDVSGAGR